MVVSVLCMCLIVFFLNKKEKESVTLNQSNKQSINQSINYKIKIKKKKLKNLFKFNPLCSIF